MIIKLDVRAKMLFYAACASYLGRMGQGVAILVTLPLVRESLGAELFGVWMMLSALISFMAFADLGIGNGILNHVTKAVACGDRLQLQQVIAAGYVITGAVGSFLFLSWIVWVNVSVEPTVLAGKITAENKQEVLNALSIFVAIVAVNIPASLVLRMQLGAQQGYLNGLNQLAQAALILLLIPLVIYLEGNLSELVLATFGVQAMVNIINSVIWLHRLHIFDRGAFARSIDMRVVRSLLQSSLLFFLMQLAAAFSFHSDAIVITQTLGQEAYGDFAVVQKLFFLVTMVLNSAFIGLWPAFGDALATDQKAWAMKALKRAVGMAAVVSLAGVSVLTAGMSWILEHWMRTSINAEWDLILVLAIWTVIDGVASVVASFMNGSGILRPQLIFAIVFAVIAFAFKWILIPVMGVAGAVLGTIIAYCIISVPGQIFILKKTLGAEG